MAGLGTHCILELYECPLELLDDRDYVLRSLRGAAEAAGATWLGQVSHKFDPQGVTALGLLAESHISMHTWPESRYAAVDIFTCGDMTMPRRACEYLTEAFRPRRRELREFNRGGAVVDLPAMV